MRSSGGVRRQERNAMAADSTAASTSAAVVSGVWPSVSPVAGFGTSRHSVAFDSTQLPSIKFKTLVRIAAASLMAFLDSIIASSGLFIVTLQRFHEPIECNGSAHFCSVGFRFDMVESQTFPPEGER